MYTQHLIERFKLSRKKKMLDKHLNYQYGYAFIGVGQHSISNLYPVIHYLGVPLKKICTLHVENAQKMAAHFTGCAGTDNIKDILNDDSIEGVFVSTSPRQHYDIVKQLLQAGKQVFVEKPPCFSLEELTTLIQCQGTNNCQTGLQKRFSTINQLLEPYRSKTKTYSYRYLTGPYPEGNPHVELFIHPIDNLIHLFGAIEQSSIHLSGKGNPTLFIHFTHQNGITGMLHLSTDFSWQHPADELEINTTSSILQASYPFKLSGIQKPIRFLNLPLEKILKTPVHKKIYLDNNGFALTAANNSLALQGFLGEIEHFVSMTEQGIQDGKHNLQSLVATYQILEKLKEQVKS